MRRTLWIAAILAGAALSVAAVVWATWPEPPLQTDWSGEYNTAPQTTSPGDFPVTYDLVSRPLGSIPPGTVVESSPPPGWSHLVIKSLPRVREDQKAGLSSLLIGNASWMFSTFLADVQKETIGDRARYRFNKAALGLGAKAKGRDTVLTAETGRKLGGDLGLFGGEILAKGYEVQHKAILVLSGPSMALIDTPVWFRCGEDNRLVRYRYALLVDQSTGALDVLLWRLGVDGQCADLQTAVRLAPNTIDPAELVVDRKKINGLGIPSDDAFAVAKLPPGRPVPLPEDLRKLAAQTRFTAEDAHSLDTALRKLPPAK